MKNQTRQHLLFLSSLLITTGAMAEATFHLENTANLQLVFDKVFDGSDPGCHLVYPTQTLQPNQQATFQFNNTWVVGNSCVWAGVGYRVIDVPTGGYVGYWSFNIFHGAGYAVYSKMDYPDGTSHFYNFNQSVDDHGKKYNQNDTINF